MDRVCDQAKVSHWLGRSVSDQQKFLDRLEKAGYKTLVSNDYDEVTVQIGEYFRDIRVYCSQCGRWAPKKHVHWSNKRVLDWSLVETLWSLVETPWSLVVAPWSLVVAPFKVQRYRNGHREGHRLHVAYMFLNMFLCLTACLLFCSLKIIVVFMFFVDLTTLVVAFK